MRAQSSATRPGFVAPGWLACLLLAMTFGMAGCPSGPTASELVDRVTDIRGPEGRYRMPLDYIGDGVSMTMPLGGDAPVASSDAAKVSVLTEGEKYRVQCQTLPAYLSYQEEEDWCWAAATHTIERFAAASSNRPYTTTQQQVVQRIYPELDEAEDQRAYSMQVAMAMVPEELRQQATTLSGQNIEDSGPTAAFFNDVVDVTAAVDLSTKDLISYLDQFMGVQEMVGSLAAGEPVIVSLLEKGTDPVTGAEQALAHVYVVYAADVVAIDAGDSREADVRRLHSAAQAIYELEKHQDMDFWGQSFDSISDTFDYLTNTVGDLVSGEEQKYAVERVYLVDPWKFKKDTAPTTPTRVELTGEEFAMRTFYMLNQETASRVVKEFIEKRQDSESDINQDLEEELSN